MALALETSFPGRRQELASLLGRYFAEARDDENAIKYLLIAGDDARQVYAYDDGSPEASSGVLYLTFDVTKPPFDNANVP